MLRYATFKCFKTSLENNTIDTQSLTKLHDKSIIYNVYTLEERIYMKILLTLFLLLSFSFAKHTLYYGELKLGVIEDMSTIQKNYLRINVTSKLARILLGGKKALIYYNDQFEGKKDAPKTKYKHDRYHIIDIIRKSISNKLLEGTLFISEKKYISIKKDKNYTFEYISKGKLKSNGTIKVKGNTLLSLIDVKNHIKIIKN